MPAENLTRAEASERKSLVEVIGYDISLDLTRGPEVFRATTIVEFSAREGASTFIDAITREVHSITLNGRALDPAIVSDNIRIQLDGLAQRNVLEVVADAEYTNTGEGMHRFIDPVDGETYLYTQFEVPDSRRVFAVFEQPDLKAAFTFHVTAPDDWAVVSNSPTPKPIAGPEPGSATWHFAPTPVLSSYVTAIIAGPYRSVHSELTSANGRVIPLGVFARKSLFEHVDADYIFEKTRQGFEFYERVFGYPYPFEKYDQLFVPEFNAGAMENAGAITFTETYVFRSKVTDAVRERRVVTILHELAHMWFGDLVTMKWWNDLWLNESFAEYMSTLATAEATEWREAWTTFQAMEKSWAYKQDQLPSTHPVVAEIRDLEDVQVNFDGITYAKGGSVLKQLAAWVGRDAFFSGVAAYFRKHEYANTELKDLLAELEATSGRDLESWSEKWLETAGVNTLRPEIRTGPAGEVTAFAIVQSAPAEHPTIRPHRMAIGCYELQDGVLTRTRQIELDVDGERTDVPELVGAPKPDLVLLNDDDLAYAKIRLDEDSLRVAIEHLAQIEDPLARSLVWGSVWDSTRDAETMPSDYVRLVLGNIASETESTTIRTTLGQLLTVARNYVDPDAREDTIREVGDRLWQLAQEAKAGSDAQFQFVKFFASIASTPEHARTLASLRDGSISLPGLAIDTDLSWELLEGLVLLGAAGTAEIDAMLASDNTSNGQQAAARARATFPTEEGKRAAFDQLVSGARAGADEPAEGLSNVIVRNIALGYQHVNDPQVLAGLVEPYFDALQDVWDNYSYKIAEYIVLGLYPAPLASKQLADATRTWLEHNRDVPALHRLVSENLAGVERALAAQARDAA